MARDPMKLVDLIVREGIAPELQVANKKQLLQWLADRAATLSNLNARDVFEALLQRERLGSTGLGKGIAIPHVQLSGLDRTVCLFARLATPIPFESIDGEPVDLVFLLLAPEHAGGDHLKALARVSRVLREPDTIEKLRAARDAGALFELLSAPESSKAA